MPPFRNHMHDELASLTPILLVLFNMRPGRGVGQGAGSYTKRIMQYNNSGVFNGGNFIIDIIFSFGHETYTFPPPPRRPWEVVKVTLGEN